MRGGVAVMGAGLFAAVVLVKTHLPLELRGLSFLPFFVGSLLFFQAAYRTCVYRAFRRQRETVRGVQPVVDPQEARDYFVRARRVLVASFAAAATLTGTLFLLP